MTLSELLSAKREEILRICEKYGARNVRVFGSAVRGEDREDSDIDFLAVNQITFQDGRSTRRLDIVLFVNGLPLSSSSRTRRMRARLGCLPAAPDVHDHESCEVI